MTRAEVARLAAGGAYHRADVSEMAAALLRWLDYADARNAAHVAMTHDWPIAEHREQALKAAARALLTSEEACGLIPSTRLDPATCRAQGHGRVVCERCGAELVGLERVRGRAER